MKKEFMIDMLEISDLLGKEIKINPELGNATKREEYHAPKPWMQPKNYEISTENEIITATLNSPNHEKQKVMFVLKQESDNYDIINGMNIDTAKMIHGSNKETGATYFNPVRVYKH